MSADRIEPPPWIRSPWVIWAWMLVVAVVVAQSLSYHWRSLPTTAAGYFTRGRSDYMTGEYEGAIDNLTKSIERNADDPESFIWRGEAFAKLGAFDKAKPDLDKALALKPDYAKAHAALADYHAALWDRESAIKEFSTAIAEDPVYARCYLERAQLDYDAGRWNDAVDDSRKAAALTIEDRQATARLLLWLARARSGDAAGATAELSTFVSFKRLDLQRFWAGAKFFGGDFREPAFLAAMAAIKDGDEDELKAEAFFFAGGKRLAFGDLAGGLAMMRNAVNTGADGSYAFDRARVELERSLLGFEPRCDQHGALAVAFVTEGGVAEVAGVKPGAAVTTIDGKPADREAFLEMLAAATPGTTVRLQLKDKDGSQTTVELPLRLDVSVPTK